MRSRFLPLLLAVLLPILANAQESEPTPTNVVNKRNKALAEHDLPAFLSTYADNVEIFVYPDKPLSKGKERLQSLFAPMFKKGDIQLEVVHQSASDSYVVCESVLSFGDKSEATIGIYEVRNGLIQTVRFLRDGMRAAQTKRDTSVNKPAAGKQ